MPQVITPPVGQSNGDKVIEFVDAVGPVKTDYTFSVKQNSLTIVNNGSSSVEITVNSTTTTLKQYEKYSVVTDFTQFSAKSTTDITNQINVRTIVFATLDIKDGSISGADLAPGSVTDDKLAKPKVDVPDPLVPKIVIGTTLSTNTLGIVGYSQEPMGDQLVMYDFGGQVNTAAPTDAAHAATKKYVDDQITANKLGTMSSAEATTGTATTARAITAAVLTAGAKAAVKNKTEIAALTALADPATASSQQIATLLNSVIAALKA